MRCPNCNKKQAVAAGSNCLNCGHTIVFDPKKDTLSDQEFKELTTTIRGAGEVYFTKNQLYSYYLEAYKASCFSTLVFFLLALGSFLFLINAFFIQEKLPVQSTYLNSAAIACFSLSMTGLFGLPKKKPKISKVAFDGLIERWMHHYPIPNLLIAPSLQQPPPGNFSEPDLYDYGVEGIIIVDRDIYVDLFVLNDYLSDWKSVIIAQSGYPNYLIDNVQKIIDNNPTIKVYYLHDATTGTNYMKEKVRQFLRMPASLEELDMGVNVDDSRKMDIFKRRGQEEGGIRLDFIPPARLAQTMGLALVGGLLLSEVLNTYENRSNSSGSFG